MPWTCVRCNRTFTNLKNALPEHAFEPPKDAIIDPYVAADVAERKGMTQLAKRDIPEGETARPGCFLQMIDGMLHEFVGGGQ